MTKQIQPQHFSFPKEKQELEELGYTVLKECVTEHTLKTTKHHLINNIKECAEDLSVESERYLRAVSRWVHPSPVLEGVRGLLEETISKRVSLVLGESVIPIKWNVICKNAYNTHPVPLHQDICYSPDEPYQVSAWLALDDVDDQSGPLIVCQRSHKEVLQPAVDFWSPEYQPFRRQSTRIPVQKGDIILFDSRLWHGSSGAIKGTDRYAFVSRWSCQSYQPPQNIPAIKKQLFGMWTCQKVAQDILTQGSKFLYQKEPDDFLDLLDVWITQLNKGEMPFKLSFKEALFSLTQIKILHLANARHNGGDASGTLYKDLWRTLLEVLQLYIKEAKNEQLKDRT